MYRTTVKAVPVSALEPKYQQMFTFPYFNNIQSEAFNSIMVSDDSVVVSSPTGSGKTVIFELAIIKVLKNVGLIENSTIIYVAPIKALCSERHLDWSLKFAPLGIKCLELTGDSDISSSDLLLFLKECKVTIILTTPEKLDSLTRKWRDYGLLITSVDLFLIDEVHLLNEHFRGPTLETVVSRIRTIRLCTIEKCLRFIACSATVMNAIDVAEWLGSNNQRALLFESSEEQRPVKLEKIILGYSVPSNSSLFKFDISLTYKIPDIITKYSHGKPTLIFCSTRKSVQQTADYLAKSFTRILHPEVQAKLVQSAGILQDSKIREIIRKGVGFHHAGLGMNDRRIIEQLFLQGYLPVLVSTSTLSLGVNLPAHLVIIKSTTQIVSGSDGQEYSAEKLLQMIGRAGRPQFDTSATAVIMTKAALTQYYENIIKTGAVVESCLHVCLKEHLNAEVTLGTITDISMAVAWLRTTFLFVRALKQPMKYGIRIPHQPNNPFALRDIVERYLFDLCLRELNALGQIELLDMKEMTISPTATGKLMARYYVTFDTMKLFSEVNGQKDLSSLLDTISQASEFKDFQLRVNERKFLNQLNCTRSETHIRFPLSGRISSRQMKINCLIQATLSCLHIPDPMLSQETTKIMRLAHRLSKCLVEYLWCRVDRTRKYGTSLKNALILSKCLKCGLWENSPYVSKQVEGIGLVLSRNLVCAGYTTFASLKAAHPRDLEKILNRGAPFGSRLLNLFQLLPQYLIDIKQTSSNKSAVLLNFRIQISNRVDVKKTKLTVGENHTIYFLVTDTENNVLLKSRLTDAEILRSELGVEFKLTVHRARGSGELEFTIISESWTGLDVSSKFVPIFKEAASSKEAYTEVDSQVQSISVSSNSNISSLEFEDGWDFESDFHKQTSRVDFGKSQEVSKILETKTQAKTNRERKHCPEKSQMHQKDSSIFVDTSFMIVSGDARKSESDAQMTKIETLVNSENEIAATVQPIRTKDFSKSSRFGQLDEELHWEVYRNDADMSNEAITRGKNRKYPSSLGTFDEKEDFYRDKRMALDNEEKDSSFSKLTPIMTRQAKSKDFAFDFEF